MTDPRVLVPAYDDAAGVTAQFDLNVLSVLNKQLGADFDLDRFRHVAVWNPVDEWIEMRLEATADMTVHVADLGLAVRFAAGGADAYRDLGQVPAERHQRGTRRRGLRGHPDVDGRRSALRSRVCAAPLTVRGV